MLKWIGDKKGLMGLPGIPAKDLSAEELARRGLNEKELLATGLYLKVKESKHGRKEEATQDSTGS